MTARPAASRCRPAPLEQNSRWRQPRSLPSRAPTREGRVSVVITTIRTVMTKPTSTPVSTSRALRP